MNKIAMDIHQWLKYMIIQIRGIDTIEASKIIYQTITESYKQCFEFKASCHEPIKFVHYETINFLDKSGVCQQMNPQHLLPQYLNQ